MPPVDAVTVVSLAALALVLAALAVFAVLALRRAPRLWDAPLRRLAAANGWRFDEEAPQRLLDRFAAFSPLRQARPPKREAFGKGPEPDHGEHRVGPVVTGRAYHHHFHVFQSTWRVPEAVRRRDGGPAVRRHAVVAVLMGERAPAPLQLRRRRAMPEHRRRDPSDVAVGPRAFRLRWHVACADHAFAQEVLPGLTRFVARSRMDWEWRGSWLVVHHTGRLQGRDVLRVLRKVMVCTRLLPEAYQAPPPRFVVDDEPEVEPPAPSAGVTGSPASG